MGRVLPGRAGGGGAAAHTTRLSCCPRAAAALRGILWRAEVIPVDRPGPSAVGGPHEDGYGFGYLVTARHVAKKVRPHGDVVIRVNKKGEDAVCEAARQRGR